MHKTSPLKELNNERMGVPLVSVAPLLFDFKIIINIREHSSKRLANAISVAFCLHGDSPSINFRALPAIVMEQLLL